MSPENIMLGIAIGLGIANWWIRFNYNKGAWDGEDDARLNVWNPRRDNNTYRRAYGFYHRMESLHLKSYRSETDNE